MTAKEYLMRANNIDLEIDSLNISIQKCRERATKITSVFSDLPAQHNGDVSDKIGLNVAEMVDYTTRALEMMKESEQLKVEIMIQIHKMANKLYAALLIDKYISNMTWQEVAEHINKEYDYTKGVLHDRALSNFTKIIQNK